MTENQKFVDEIAIIDAQEEKVILDLGHDPHATEEERVYKFECPEEDLKSNSSQLKVLGLALMLSRNPKEADTQKYLQEVFMPEDEPSISDLTGFYFHKSLERETDFHQDCACPLGRLIGLSTGNIS